MDQWKLILQALMLTLFLPLLVWTGLFVIFGWKLFLFLAIGITLLLMYGDKIIRLPMFQSLVRMLIPFGMTTAFYKALRAGKDVKDKKGSSWRAWWASLRELSSQSSPDRPLPQDETTDTTAKKSKKPRQLPAQTETAKSPGFWFGRQTQPVEEIDEQISTKPSVVSAKQTPPPQASAQAPSPRKKNTEEDIERSLAELKAKMAREKRRNNR